MKDKEKKKFLRRFKKMASPNKVGRSEYRLVHDYVTELIEENDFDEYDVLSSLEQLQYDVQDFIEALSRKA